MGVLCIMGFLRVGGVLWANVNNVVFCSIIPQTFPEGVLHAWYSAGRGGCKGEQQWVWFSLSCNLSFLWGAGERSGE